MFHCSRSNRDGRDVTFQVQVFNCFTLLTCLVRTGHDHEELQWYIGSCSQSELENQTSPQCELVGIVWRILNHWRCSMNVDPVTSA